MQRNPWDPEVPCHRIIAANGVSYLAYSFHCKTFTQLGALTNHFFLQYIGGFKGVWNQTPDGKNCELKLSLPQKEGVEFD